jgi:uncharacterized membrane protein
MMIDYFNGCAYACSLGIAAQIKIMGESLLVFSGIWFGIYLRLPPGKYKIVSWKKKEFKDLEELLVSFRLYFVIVEVSYHVLFVTMNIYGIDCQKKSYSLESFTLSISTTHG